ncbi:MAG: tRNA lysidine(34) synthetase TilS [Treponema sp.]|nr:tRNA lysidine(34) synthetase TilS [Treponema sp.]
MNPAEFEAAVAAAIQNCPAGTVFVAAVSGGADSTAMLAALAAIRVNMPSLSLRCIHVEHGIRAAEESQGDAFFTRSLCEQFDIPCRVAVVPPGRIAAAAKKQGIGIEAAARLYRRRAWFREARRIEAAGGTARILTAHTRNDMLETTLMRIIRGAGPVGLAAMPARRGRILRPLLGVRRADVIQYLEARTIPWREDSSNADMHFLRNRVRRRLVPCLNELFPGWETGIAALAGTQSLAAACITAEARNRVTWTPDGGLLRTGAETFFSLPPIIREEALFQAIDRLAARPRSQRPGNRPVTVRRSVLRRFCEGRCKAAALGPARVRQDGNVILLSAEKSAHSEYGFSLLIKMPGLYNLKGVGINVSACSGGTSHDGGVLALLPLVVRSKLPGDCIAGSGGEAARCRGRVVCLVDRLGTAALTGPGGIILGGDPAGQETRKAEQEGLCTVELFNHRPEH